MSFPKKSTNSGPRKINRFFRHLTGILILSLTIIPFESAQASAPSQHLSKKEFLRTIQKDALGYFLRCSDSRTGLTRDSSRPGSPASIAATGFSLAALCIAQEQGWVSYSEAYEYILKTLQTLDRKAQHKNGFFFHFLDARTGRRTWGSEASSIDTALVLAGALLAGEYFKGTPVEKLAQKIYRRVNWKWMMNGSDLICMGWKPENGFLPYYWDSYNELIILQALAIGSPSFPIPSTAWNQWDRFEDEYNSRKVIYSHSGSLFTYQYSQAFIDFRNLDDKGVNYFENSKQATLANKEFCYDNRLSHKTYDESFWGLTASLGPGGYRAYGAKPGQALHDGTVAPHACAASIVFTPKEVVKTLRELVQKYPEKVYGEFGFRDSFNLEKNWWAYEYLGIDQGIMVLMIENHLTENVWKRFMNLRPVEKWISLCGLEGIRSQNGTGKETSG